ncbi:MAG: hypothetical protein V1835_06675 [Candidatus Micrarchaeota archaeon]
MENKEEFAKVTEEFQRFQEQVNNPVFIATLMHKLSEERSSTNLLFKELNQKLDRLLALEDKIKALEQKLETASTKAATPIATRDALLLPKIDETILNYVQKKGKVCAEQVQMKFKYKGTNAASSRLNRLVKEGVLRKQQVGRKVFFLPTQLFFPKEK